MKQTRGFTLIELLVVMAIMAIVSTIILSGNAKFGGIISLRNLAYDVALTMREAQTYGISARRFSSGGVTTFSPGYGVHIGGAPATQYILFADTNESGRYKAYGWIKTWGGAQAALAACNSLGDHALDCIESVGRGAATEKTLASGAGISALCMSLSGQAQDRCILGEMMKYIDINIAETDSACTKIDPVYHDACERALADYKDTILYDR
jgi:prepilin-type N-terminal cleavage/methylation domain-containing protein